MTFRILDLFCGAGGAAKGLATAIPDAEILGIDIRPQPHYPFAFLQADALETPIKHCDFVWASPPCQAYSVMRNLPWNQTREYPELIPLVRELLRAWGGPYIIENVMGAQRKADMQAGWLCGTMFNRPFYRHRVFESNFLWLAPPHGLHRTTIRAGYQLAGRARAITWSKSGSGPLSQCQQRAKAAGITFNIGHTRGPGEAQANRRAMGIDWMTSQELSQSVPPCYSQFLAHFIPGAPTPPGPW